MEADRKTIRFEGFAEKLKEARTKKGLSQRSLSEKIGVPQSHMSKIESGQVDVRASSLIEIARALDLELMLVPQKLVPAVEALSRPPLKEAEKNTDMGLPVRTEADTTIHEARRALERIEKDARRISRVLGAVPEITRLHETVRELNGMRITLNQAEQVREVIKNIAIPKDLLKKATTGHHNVSETLKRTDVARLLREVTQATNTLKNIRNAIAHGATSPIVGSIPAYRLTDGDEDA